MEKKWIFISALMHAALLLGVFVAPRPVLNPVPVILEVSLVSSPPGDLTNGNEPNKASGTPPIVASVKAETRQEPESDSEKPVKTNPESSALSAAEHELDMEKTDETVSERTITVMVRKSIVEPNSRITSADFADNTVTEDTAVGSAQDGSHLFTGDHVSQLQASNFKHQTSLLAFSGDPSTLGGFLTGETGIGLVRSNIISLPEPVYPFLSRRKGEEGRVVIKAKISAEGGVLGARVTKSSSHPRLDQAALDAVRLARFSPATEYGRPVSSERTVAYTFRLEGK